MIASIKCVSAGVLAWVCVAGCGTIDGAPEFCSEAFQLTLDDDCDIREPDCQRAVFDATACVRRAEGSPPPLRVISEAEYEDELRGDDDAGVDDAGFDPWDESLRLLHLLEPQKDRSEAFIEESASNVAAYYSGEYRDVTIIDRGDDGVRSGAMRVLSHEFVHALQDTDFGLAQRRGRYSYDDDNLIALSNVIEGEASLRAELAYGLLSAIPATELGLEGHFGRYLASTKAYVASHASPYVAAKRGLHYATGPLYFAQVFAAEGSDGLDELMASFPLTSVQWMAGYGARETYAAEVPLQCRNREGPAGYDLYATDVLGAAVLFAFLGSERAGELYDVASAWELALQWRAEDYRVFAHEDAERSALLWQIRFADGDAAERFVDAATAIDDSLRTVVDGPEVRLFAASDDAVLTPWIDEASSRCQPEREPE